MDAKQKRSPAEWLVGTSTAMLKPCNPDDFAKVRDAGLQCIELTMFGAGADPSEAAGMELLARRVEYIREYDLKLWSVHLPFGRRWDLAAADEDIAAASVEQAKRFVQVAAGWGAEVAVIHPSTEPIKDEERDQYLARSVAGLKQVAQAAVAAGIRLAVECLPRTCLCNTSDEMLSVLAQLEDVGACFDANHPLQEPPEQFAAKLGGRIHTVHISDYDGVDERHWLPGEGTINWDGVIGALAEGGYSGPFMFEVGQQKAEGVLRTPADLAACWQRLLASYLQSIS